MMGYNGAIPSTVRESAAWKALPASMQKIRNVSSLGRTQAGVDFWLEHGDSFDATFNLKAGSSDRQALNAYVRERYPR